jgi:hypothetical protein
MPSPLYASATILLDSISKVLLCQSRLDVYFFKKEEERAEEEGGRNTLAPLYKGP